MLHSVADAERNLGFLWLQLSRACLPKGKGFFTQNKGTIFCKAISEEMRRKRGKTRQFSCRSVNCSVPQRQQLYLVKLAQRKLHLQVNAMPVAAFVGDAELPFHLDVIRNKPRDTRAKRLHVPCNNFARC